MHILFAVVLVLVAAATAVPCLEVPECPALSTVTYNTPVPSSDDAVFPRTEVALCYDDSFIRITFSAFEEESFYCMSNPN